MPKIIKELKAKEYESKNRLLTLFRIFSIAFITIALLHAIRDLMLWDGIYLNGWRHVMNAITIVLSVVLCVVAYKEFSRINIREGFYATLFDSMDEGVLVFNKQRQLTYSSFEHLIGDDNVQIGESGFPVNMQVKNIDGTPIDEMSSPMVRALRGEVTKNREIVIQLENQAPRHFLLNAKPMYPYRGVGVIGCVVVVHEITDRNKMERNLRVSEEKYRLLAENTDDLISTMGMCGEVLYVSPSHRTMLGIDSESYIGQQGGVYVHPEDLSRMRVFCQTIRITQEANTTSFRHLNLHTNQYIWLETKGSPLIDRNGNLQGVILASRDVTGRKTWETLMENQNRILKMLAHRNQVQENLNEIVSALSQQVEGATVAIYQLDTNDQSLCYCSGRKVIDKMPLTDNEFVGVRCALSGKMTNATNVSDPSFWKHYKIREDHDIHSIWCNPIFDWTGDVVGILSLYFHAIKERTEQEDSIMETYTQLAGLAMASQAHDEEIEELAYKDSLTHLPNRRGFTDACDHLISTSKDSHSRFALMVLDIDRFKSVNDTLGHPYGDDLLVQVAQRLQKVEGVHLYRMGGDEFTLLLPHIKTKEESQGFAENILAMMQHTFTTNGYELQTTASIGIAVYPDDGADTHELLRNADVAMYQSKKDGKNTATLYHPTMNDQFYERLMMENRLRQALDNDEFFLMYQPKVNLETREVIGLEALLRWNSPDGFVPPSAFIPLAEETGQIIPIGKWVIEEVCRTVKTIEQMGWPHLRVSLNVSPRQFLEHDLIGTIRKAIDETSANPKWLEVEITEGVLLEHEEEAIRKIKALRDLGLHISIDDFGVGYSSLSRLHTLPITEIKIDRTFIKDIEQGEGEIAVLVINLAHSLGLAVIAEGVETQEQWDFLTIHNCDNVQGYFFSRPVVFEDLAPFFTKTSANTL